MRNCNLKGGHFMSAKIISVFNGKGGAGKTTLVTNINAHMKTKELKLLVIDTDPQRNLYGINAPDFVHYEPSLFNIMKKEISIKKVIQQTDGYHLIPTSDNQNDLNTSINDFTVLKNSLEEIQDEYDVILIDNSPAFTPLTYSSLFASQYILSPCQVTNECLNAVLDLMALVNSDTFKNINPSFKGVGVFFSQYNLASKRQSIINRSIVDNFRRMSRIFGFKIFSTSIPKNVDVNAASAHHKDIFQYKEKSPVATAYKQLTDEIITFINMGGE